MSKTVIAFHGLMGSGKTTHCTRLLIDIQRMTDLHVEVVGIKTMFNSAATALYDEVEPYLTEDQKLLVKKKIQRTISTCAEEFVPGVWSNKYAKTVNSAKHNAVFLTDDIRTEANIQALTELASSGNNVVLFQLEAAEDIRRKRCTAWREGDCYTEQSLKKPEQLSPNFEWHVLDAALPLSEMNQQIDGIVLPKLG
jgi:hypothetical protein